MGTIPQIALTPPRPPRETRRKTRDLNICDSCDALLTETGECRGCSD